MIVEAKKMYEVVKSAAYYIKNNPKSPTYIGHEILRALDVIFPYPKNQGDPEKNEHYWDQIKRRDYILKTLFDLSKENTSRNRITYRKELLRRTPYNEIENLWWDREDNNSRCKFLFHTLMFIN